MRGMTINVFALLKGTVNKALENDNAPWGRRLASALERHAAALRQRFGYARDHIDAATHMPVKREAVTPAKPAVTRPTEPRAVPVKRCSNQACQYYDTPVAQWTNVLCPGCDQPLHLWEPASV